MLVCTGGERLPRGDGGGSVGLGKNQCFCFGCAGFGRPVRWPGVTQCSRKSTSLEFRREVRVEGVDLRVIIRDAI